MSYKAGTGVWITRAQPGAQRTGDAVAALGLVPVVAPVLEVGPLAPALPVGYEGVIFTSRNGVHAFSALTNRRDITALCVGDATADAARASGFAAVHSAASDAQGLHDMILSVWPKSRSLLYAAPSEPAAPVTDRLREAGFTVYEAAVYATHPVRPALSQEALASMGYVLLYSARAASQAAAVLAASNRNLFNSLVFLCLSETVATTLRRETEIENPQIQGLRTAICRFPDEASMLDLLKSHADRPANGPTQT